MVCNAGSLVSKSRPATRQRHIKMEGHCLRSGQEASEPAAYFYPRVRCALDWARLLFWSGQCLELPFTLQRPRERGEGPAAAGRRSCTNAGALKPLLPDRRATGEDKFKLLLGTRSVRGSLTGVKCRRSPRIQFSGPDLIRRRSNGVRCSPLAANSQKNNRADSM